MIDAMERLLMTKRERDDDDADTLWEVSGGLKSCGWEDSRGGTGW